MSVFREKKEKTLDILEKFNYSYETNKTRSKPRKWLDRKCALLWPNCCWNSQRSCL